MRCMCVRVCARVCVCIALVKLQLTHDQACKDGAKYDGYGSQVSEVRRAKRNKPLHTFLCRTAAPPHPHRSMQAHLRMPYFPCPIAGVLHPCPFNFREYASKRFGNLMPLAVPA